MSRYRRGLRGALGHGLCVNPSLSVVSGGFRVGGPEARLKRGPPMTSSYSANRDKHF